MNLKKILLIYMFLFIALSEGYAQNGSIWATAVSSTCDFLPGGGTFTATGPTSKSCSPPTISNPVSCSISQLPPGTYSVSYAPPSGWITINGPQTVTVISGNQSTVAIQVGHPGITGSISCTAISSTSDVLPGGGTFTATGPCIKNCSPPTISVPVSCSIYILDPGTYSVSYTPPSGWVTENSPVSVTVTAGQQSSITIRVHKSNIAGSIYCTAVSSTSDVLPGGGTFTATGPTIKNCSPPTISVPVSCSISILDPGTYSVSYAPPSGWITVNSPQTVTVTSGNQATVTIQVQSPTVNGSIYATAVSNSSQTLPGGGTFTATGPTSKSCSPPAISDPVSCSMSQLPAGTYSVSYAPPSGWVTENSPVSVTVTAGQQSSITITVHYCPCMGSIRCTAVSSTSNVLPGGGTFTATGPTTNSCSPNAVSNPVSCTISQLPPGTYSVSYTPPSGWVTLNSPQTVAVTSENQATLTIQVQFSPCACSLYCTAVSSTSDVLPGGGTFTATGPTSNSCSPKALSNPVSCSISNLGYGTYSVNYTSPSGWITENSPQTITIMVGSNLHVSFNVHKQIDVDVTIATPPNGSVLTGNGSYTILWVVTIGGNLINKFALFYTTDAGSTWTTLADSIPSNDRVFLWNPIPDQTSSLCKLKLVTYFSGNRSIESFSDLFSISSSSEALPIQSASTNDQVEVNPNPFVNVVTIRFYTDKIEQVKILILSLDGRLIKRFELNEDVGWRSLTWNGDNTDQQVCVHGLYILHFQTNDTILTKRILFLR